MENSFCIHRQPKILATSREKVQQINVMEERETPKRSKHENSVCVCVI